MGWWMLVRSTAAVVSKCGLLLGEVNTLSQRGYDDADVSSK